MQEFQSFLWLILGLFLIFILFRIVRSFLKWMVIVLLITAGLIYYQPSRNWLKQKFLGTSSHKDTKTIRL